MATLPSTGLELDVVYLTTGGQRDWYISDALKAMNNVEYVSKGHGRVLRYHFIVDGNPLPPSLLCKGSMASRIYTHHIEHAPGSTKALHERLQSTASGPGSQYLWKNLVHELLPAGLKRCVLLDADLFLFSGLADL